MVRINSNEAGASGWPHGVPSRRNWADVAKGREPMSWALLRGVGRSVS